MTATAFVLLAIALAIAVIDWMAVDRDQRSIEFVAKPAVMIALVAVALALDPVSDTARVLLVIGLVASTAGDVFLMLPRDLFVAGLASFLIAHLFYIVALAVLGIGIGSTAMGGVVMLVVLGLVGRRVVEGAARVDRALLAPVTAYMIVLATMVAFAIGTGRVFAIVGAVAFAASDTILGWTRFVGDLPRSRTVVMITYHLGQMGLVLALI